MQDTFETVHTMTDYYDGPRKGIANFNGKPHIYESTWEDHNYSDIFLLSPVEPSVLEQALEDWAIWLRWEAAFHAGQATLETHPALPADRGRHEELKKGLEVKLQIDREHAFKATAEFKARVDLSRSGKGFRPLEVLWTPIETQD